ncbi:MAG: lactoylglutathione lyase [Comamonadaceae bacterium]|nr:MAG: lactoylglutathione lyase [Comamonadaceae bacterium]
MPRTITVSLPVADLQRAKAFYTALGFVINPQFSDDAGAFMVWSETINVMLLSHAKWQSFTTRPIAPSGSSEMALNISLDSRDEVDAISQLAADNGATPDVNPVEDHGFMYGRDFLDPDGHVWGVQWMDASAMPKRPA